MPVPAPRYHQVPAAQAMPAPARPVSADVSLDPEFLPPATPPASPAARMQWELYQRFHAERRPAPAPFPLPVRLALMAGGGMAGWGAVYLLARTILNVMD